ncbi:conserved hypothetical protein [Flavobacterium sp. 9AF]|uniref:hypothetical protein n=1 Tax=Flavobacterium sp. 9AF TaxID=2653142 RepID=UPI0012F229E4|nr:hypothetical protein [Flavobacterium sp. 9AF]VXC03096.1 conserved hypothetical protein [Flavobacterium sp. 9AF]
MKKKLIILTFILFIVSCSKKKDTVAKKDFLEKIQELVLSEDKIGQEYLFRILLENQFIEYKISYIGQIENNQKGKIKFLFLTTFSGLNEDSKRANSRLIIYKSSNNDKIGYYYLGGIYKDSIEISDNTLILPKSGENCNLTTEISFKDSIPDEIFINCTKSGGDFYKFERE